MSIAFAAIAAALAVAVYSFSGAAFTIHDAWWVVLLAILAHRINRHDATIVEQLRDLREFKNQLVAAELECERAIEKSTDEDERFELMLRRYGVDPTDPDAVSLFCEQRVRAIARTLSGPANVPSVTVK